MGNYISCTMSTPISKHSIRGTKVILPSGEILNLYESTEAAELMLETPNHFLTNTKSLQVGKRFSAVNADERLQMGNAYAFFPMRRRNEVVAEADVAPLLSRANSAKKVSLGCVKISPESVSDVQIVRNSDTVPKLKLDEIEEFSTVEFKHRLFITRSKKPLLETIVEEPVSLSRWSVDRRK